jgi:hypothetical protein
MFDYCCWKCLFLSRIFYTWWWMKTLKKKIVYQTKLFDQFDRNLYVVIENTYSLLNKHTIIIYIYTQKGKNKKGTAKWRCVIVGVVVLITSFSRLSRRSLHIHLERIRKIKLHLPLFFCWVDIKTLTDISSLLNNTASMSEWKRIITNL